ncbi:TolB-like protein/cytochrome c-type biogenesis protein CcmH/NrfG [Bradyrhizobium japonicum]|uniref:winged helix-turn-helix domain-containing tetratricopeptide repeat protein n=1 Tax=Bradyrhizobium japonicum TaxID=375 RepID=UPI002167148B|nr:winged helix-turn-helix domain-containing tetratricopeptide repeat protein [Bradyrhizobium japonicum]MCS3496853.1 TolB-like protein/cytochrome c-type biogenesis protein CcmH/NrfG [Bradyrhizobium japonicum]MCS3960985.1 TolB-like protein/cytochrome c-type biogenesis protein CcmH/NrfG [Bradyrhizobium japonicum]MCS4002739.1 TolB-like protein/cytochrome c-type biogenesis protein CcmH/NrfG [Bradyrhizobium japonicum]
MTFHFEDFVLDPARRELRRAETLVALEPQVFDLLLYLIRNRERVVTRDNLLDAIWNGRVVSESTLTSRINAARRAVNDNGEEQRLIRTVARKGVRFVGEVTEGTAAASSPALGKPPIATPTELPLPDRPAIAVLPFTNMSGEAEQDYFSDGISEDIITALSKLRWFFVIARNSSFIYKGRTVHLRQVAEELGVRYVVEGSVRKEGDRVRITAQLNDVATGSHLWAERYDRELADVFAVQDEITERIVAAIEPQLYAAENFRAERKPPDSLDAWDLLMRALSHYWRVTRQDHVAARALLEKAIALDPNYGKALGLLGTSYMFTAHMGWMEMAAALPVAERAARAAIRADDQDAWAHNALGHVDLFARRFEDSLAEFETALRLNPNFALAQGYYGLTLSYCGRWRDADEAARRAIRLSPRDPYAPVYFGIAAFARFLGRDYAEAIRLAQEALRQRSDFVGGHRVLTAAAAMAGQTETARAALKELHRAQPNVSLAWIAEFMPIKLAADREHYLEAFRRAGLT